MNLQKFPLDSKRIENMCLTDMDTIAFDNVSTFFYSKDELRKLSIEDVNELKGKVVVYDLITDNGKHFFGYTRDFGSRIKTHLKDVRRAKHDPNKKWNEKYNDIIRYQRAVVRILMVCDCELEGKMMEKSFATEFIDMAIKNDNPTINVRNLTKGEYKTLASKYCYNVNEIYNY